MSNGFQYDDLPFPNCFRLFKLHDGAGSDPLFGTLRNTSLSEDCPSYKALSYTWGNTYESYNGQDGDPGQSNVRMAPSVICNGMQLPVRENLYDALAQVRSRRESNYLWIDSICINQGDDDEKSKQIKNMTEMYSRAKWVIIWLGKSDVEAEDAIPLIFKYAELGLMSMLGASNKKGVEYSNANSFAQHGLGALDARQWRSILIFFRRQWFRRVWTLQEISLARDTYALCGPKEFNIDEVAVFAGHLLQSGLNQELYDFGRRLPYGRSNGTGEIASSIEWIGCQRAPTTFGKGSIVKRYCPNDPYHNQTRNELWLTTLDILIRHIRLREAKDVRDRIIAPLAFASRFVPLELETAVKDLMDYRKTVEKVYIDLTNFFITSSQRLDILSQVNKDTLQTAYELPSWVPAFNTPLSGSLIEGTYFNAAKSLGGTGMMHHKGQLAALYFRKL